MARQYTDQELQQVEQQMAAFDGDWSKFIGWKRQFEAERGISHVETTMDKWVELGSQARSSRWAKPSNDRVASAFNRATGDQPQQQGSGRVMAARYDGRCADCGGAIHAGDTIRFDGKPHHSPACPQREETVDEKVARWNADPRWDTLAQREQERETSIAQSLEHTTPADPTPSKLAIREGVFTVVSGSERRTFRVHTPKMGNLAGKTILQYLSGSDNTSDYTGFAFVTSTGIAVWKRFQADTTLVRLARVLLDPKSAAEAGLAYAMESGNCCKCGRTLTVPASIAMGMGPVCAAGGWD